MKKDWENLPDEEEIEIKVGTIKKIQALARQEAGIKEMLILEKHLDRQITERTVYTHAIYKYIDDRIKDLSPSNGTEEDEKD